MILDYFCFLVIASSVLCIPLGGLSKPFIMSVFLGHKGDSAEEYRVFLRVVKKRIMLNFLLLLYLFFFLLHVFVDMLWFYNELYYEVTSLISLLLNAVLSPCPSSRAYS